MWVFFIKLDRVLSFALCPWCLAVGVVHKDLLGWVSFVFVCGSMNGLLTPSIAGCKGVLPTIWPNDSSALFVLDEGDIGVKLGQEVRRNSLGQLVSLKKVFFPALIVEETSEDFLLSLGSDRDLILTKRS